LAVWRVKWQRKNIKAKQGIKVKRNE
jgi:hypothetical protein